MYRKILVGYDGSETAKHAFNAALDLAQKYGAELYALSVARTPDIGDDVETEAVMENSRRYHRGLLEELRATIGASRVKAHYEVAAGHPAEQILYYADQHEADLIVIGHRGRSTFVRLVLGSVSKQVVQHANQPVLVVR